MIAPTSKVSFPRHMIDDLVNGLNPANEEQRKLARRFVELVEDENPFPVDFDEAWRLLKCSKKGHAKRSLERCGAVEGVEYLIYKNNKLSSKIQIPQLGHFPHSQNTAAIVKNGTSVPNRSAGKPKEKIYLSQTAFDLFATSVNKDIRRFFVKCKHAILVLKQKIQNGEVAIATTQKAPATKALPTWEANREKSVDKHNNLMHVCNSGLRTGNNHPGFYASVNHELNKMATGLTKTELATDVREDRPKKNWIMRDYMSEDQLCVLAAAQQVAFNKIRKKGDEIDEIEKKKIVNEVCESFSAGVGKFLHGAHLQVPRKRNRNTNAIQDCKKRMKICDKKKQTKINFAPIAVKVQ